MQVGTPPSFHLERTLFCLILFKTGFFLTNVISILQNFMKIHSAFLEFLYSKMEGEVD